MVFILVYPLLSLKIASVYGTVWGLMSLIIPFSTIFFTLILKYEAYINNRSDKK